MPGSWSSIARWNGSAWSVSEDGAGDAASAWIRSFYTSGDDLWASGAWASDIDSYSLLLRWRNGAWMNMNPGMRVSGGGSINAIRGYRGGIVVAGAFLHTGDLYTGYVAGYDPEGWHAFGPSGQGLDGWVNCFLPADDGLYVGGGFSETATRAEELHSLSRWDGAQWHSLHGGVQGSVYAMTWYEGRLVIAGAFRRAGDVEASNIAQWDGQGWAPLGAGTSGRVTALQVYQGDLYAGGEFWQAGEGKVVAHIARWDGRDWCGLSGGARGGGYPQPMVTDLAVYDGDLIVAGNFTETGGFAVPGIARWDGSIWHHVGEPPWTAADARTSQVEVWNGRLVAHGCRSEGEWTLPAIWDGIRWTEIPIEMFRNCGPLGTYRGYLVVGGPEGGNWGIADDLVLWDGTKVSRLGSGVRGDWLSAFQEWQGDLYVGGEFRVAGGKASRNIACYFGSGIASSVAPMRISVLPNPVRTGAKILLYVPVAAGGDSHSSPAATLELFDVLGRKMRSFPLEVGPGGEAALAWDGRDQGGRILASGTYFLRIKAESGSSVQKVRVVR